ncbi:MAG: hypothetical protein H0V70_01255 [Ktedonobacteraceae bacterium]|nr:hypothetical protein [Ktedonobacteraceae bacterium]
MCCQFFLCDVPNTTPMLYPTTSNGLVAIQPVPGNLVVEIVFTLLWVLLPLYVLDWWHTSGFQTVLTWPLYIRGYRGLFLGLFLLLGLFPLLLLTFSSTIHRTASTTILLITLLSLFVGIAEEGLFRGLILNILLIASNPIPAPCMFRL